MRQDGRNIFNEAPVVKRGVVRWDAKHSPAQEKLYLSIISGLLQRMINAVDRKELHKLEKYISKKRGVWIDLKTHISFSQFKKMVRDKNGYLEMFFLDTKKLRAFKNDAQTLAVRDVLRHTRFVVASFYMESEKNECELQLHLQDYPAYNFYLNNPVFIKEKGIWKIYRLF